MRMKTIMMAVAGLISVAALADENQVKIGFLVHAPDQPWFQQEWTFAQQCADKNGFKLIKIGATDGEKMLAAIDNLGVQGVQGFVICPPDVRLGPAIVARARANRMKLLSVDNRFIGANGAPMDDVAYVGISARSIGGMVGKALWLEMTRRGWKVEETALCAVTYEELQTTKERTDGAMEALASAGFPKDKIFKAPMKVGDVEGAMNAATIVLIQHPGVKRWLICGINDDAVMGAVRATEGRSLTADNVVGIGINGTDCLVEFGKEKPTGFFASVLLAPKRHGYDTAEMMYRWIKDGVEPPKITHTDGILITRENYEEVRKQQGLD